MLDLGPAKSDETDRGSAALSCEGTISLRAGCWEILSFLCSATEPTSMSIRATSHIAKKVNQEKSIGHRTRPGCASAQREKEGRRREARACRELVLPEDTAQTRAPRRARSHGKPRPRWKARWPCREAQRDGIPFEREYRAARGARADVEDS